MPDNETQSKGSRKGGLGKGLNSLLGIEPEQVSVQLEKNSPRMGNFIEIDVHAIKPNPRQPRKVFNEDDLIGLSQSLKEDGVVQPLIVTEDKGSKSSYTLIAGERRWRASQIAGFKKVPALVKNVSPDEVLRIAIIENVQRANLNIIEEAEAYAALIKDFGLTQEECAKKIGKDRATVTNILRILTLPEEVQENLLTEKLSMGHGRALLGLNDKSQILRAQDIILAKKLSVRQTEQLVRKIKNKPQKEETQEDENYDLDYLAENLRNHLRTKVRLSGSGSRGRIEISYFSAAELERLLASIGGTQFE